MSAFAGIVGQDAAIQALRSDIERGGGSGSTLILGPEGVGRFLLAHAAARAILGEPALVNAFNHPDLNVLDPTDGIDGVRSAAAALQRRPARGPRQVLIIRDADRLSHEAHNALLKTLEEPPAGAAIYVIASDPALLPETVVSRCRSVRARPLSEAEMGQLGFSLDIARVSEGAPGRAHALEASGALEGADRLASLLLEPRPDPLAEADKLARKQKDETGPLHRRRVEETLKVVAARLRGRLPESEPALRCVVEALGSLAANANPGIVLADLVLHRWKKAPPTRD